MNYLIPVLAILILGSCQVNSEKGVSKTGARKDTTGVFSGIKRYYSEGKIIKEVTFVNGLRNGICKNYYDDGRLKSTIIYRNNIKEDTAKWYYTEGMVYRITPYVNDRIHGTQIKYYKNGRIQASLPYRNGLRLPGLKEYYENGVEVKSNQTIDYNISNQYNTNNGLVRVFLKLSQESIYVDYYHGSLVDNAFDPEKCRKVTASSGMGFIELHKDPGKGRDYVDVIAVYTTRFGNNEILTRRIKLPYKDLI